MVVGSNHFAVNSTSDFLSVSSKELLDITANIEYRFTLKRVRDIIRTYSQIHGTDKYLKQSSLLWLVGLNHSVFLDELSGCGFESRCSH